MFHPPRSVRPPLVRLRAAALGAAVLFSSGPAAGADAEARAILAADCVKCHGPTKQKGGFRGDGRAGLLGKVDSGAPAVVPGSPSPAS
jgi:mono/diheme cytochrome c family protein